MNLRATYEWQLSVRHPLKVVCSVCYWSSSNFTTDARYCPYGHGPLNKIGEIHEEVKVSSTIEGIPQVCLKCGFRGTFPKMENCPTCFDYPAKISLVASAPYQDWILPIEPEKPEEIIPGIILPKMKPGQISLFGGAA